MVPGKPARAHHTVMVDTDAKPLLVAVATTCPDCHRTSAPLVLDAADYQRWAHGLVIQQALPGLNPEQRERLMTGICGECWDKAFDPMPDEEEE